MKQFVFLIIALSLLLINCTSENTNPEDKFYHEQVTSTELEAGTATYRYSGSATYYLVFKDGSLYSYEFHGDRSTIGYYDKYEIKGDSIYLTKKPYYEEIFGGETKYYALYIRKVHWGFDKTSDGGTGGTQILIDGDNAPSEFRTGYYDFSIISLK